MEEVKFCDTCKWCVLPRSYRGMQYTEYTSLIRCSHPKITMSCLEARFLDATCGREGKLYEAKEVERWKK